MKTYQLRITRFWGKIFNSNFHPCKKFDILQVCGFDPSWDVEMVWFWYSWDVEMVWFWSLVRCQNGLVLILVRCRDGMVLILVRSSIVWCCPSWDVKMVWFTVSSWGVSFVWFFPREKSNPPDASRGSTTSHESYQTSHEGEIPREK